MGWKINNKVNMGYWGFEKSSCKQKDIGGQKTLDAKAVVSPTSSTIHISNNQIVIF